MWFTGFMAGSAPLRVEDRMKDFLSASVEPAEGCRRQIFGGREHDLAA